MYPAIAENTTLNDSLILVISLKSEIAETLGKEDFFVANQSCI
jgi:hypothetical protein